MNNFQKFNFYLKAKKIFHLENINRLFNNMREVGYENCDITIYNSEDGRYTNLYYGNLHFYVDNMKDNHIVEVYIKMENEEWDIDKKDKSKCNNHQFLIYRYYRIDMFNDHNIYSNEVYYNGAWDKHAYETFWSIMQMVEEKTDKSVFENAYEKFINNDIEKNSKSWKLQNIFMWMMSLKSRG